MNNVTFDCLCFAGGVPVDTGWRSTSQPCSNRCSRPASRPGLIGHCGKTANAAPATAAPRPTTTNPLAGAEITPQQGGIPVFKDGKIIAAIGAGGSMPATDEKVAQAGADAAN